MRTPAEVYADFHGRRNGIVLALTRDFEKFYADCDPDKDNLVLFSFPDGTWAVDYPAEEVPPEMPEPALGINFARDGMTRKDWMAIVAVHADAWLMATAFYKGARLTKEERAELFALINQQPTCYEVVTGRAGSGSQSKPAQPGLQQQQAPGVKKHHPASGEHNARKRPATKHEDDEEDDDDDDSAGWADGEGDPCPLCRKYYEKDEFWIECDKCKIWYCGRCARMTEKLAQKVEVWYCGDCQNKKGRT
mmetsp:Transcript_5385/g.9299  ORF Transcript_5385/g.9299 Transcript_5385/m.9299 type:complete len:249 (+) Transcript_5385:186-932(+)|eukprot:CAMPEP_0119102712 /NCGR_PEP_ID=MMETSP1180-20130426/1357_1 /TAXON_ID=3052 ORGANISM="Chlamydomonas cf sp, Strain CCMP681" /NCGR_SAMPLE_ID=MMETSP1180 /ASSEMBLY_ACC=CAM_ASM_000741 /LENGTH=248 /DNA_ID=CAMNT_0007087039 /DNA_START=186 /DNA_END=932 /DNA_ORIENTATION=+